MNYNAVLKYIIENLSDYREEIESTLSYIYKYRMSFQQADRGGKLEDTIMSAISDYEVDNDYEQDEILNQLLSEYDLEDIFFDAIDKMDKNVNEYKISKSDKRLLESLVSKYGKSGVNTAISRLYEEVTDSYIDDNGKRHIIWHDEDTDEMMDIIPDDNDDSQLTPNDDMNFHVDVGDYNYNKSFETLEDALEYIKNGKFAKDKFLYIYDNDYNYYDPETGEIENSDDDLGFDEISDRLIDLQNELKDYKQRRKLLMRDMENDPDVINDLNGEAAQDYGKQLGEIDEYIEELEDQIRNLERE